MTDPTCIGDVRRALDENQTTFSHVAVRYLLSEYDRLCAKYSVLKATIERKDCELMALRLPPRDDKS